MTDKKETQSIECLKKALQIAKVIYGCENFTTMECYLNLANNLEKQGQKQEADDLYTECLENFDKKDAQMKKFDEENDFNGSLNSAENISQKLLMQQQRLFGGINMSIEERDAGVI
jgi:tetratricopeptide (TPR) repeat protein